MGVLSKRVVQKKKKSVVFDHQYSFWYDSRINKEKRIFSAKSFSVYATLHNPVNFNFNLTTALHPGG